MSGSAKGLGVRLRYPLSDVLLIKAGAMQQHVWTVSVCVLCQSPVMLEG